MLTLRLLLIWSGTAAAADDVAEVVALLKSGSSVNARGNSGRTALTISAKRGNLKMLQTLIQHGAEYNDAAFGSGETPLHAAILGNHVACVTELVAQPRINVDWCAFACFERSIHKTNSLISLCPFAATRSSVLPNSLCAFVLQYLRGQRANLRRAFRGTV